MLNGCLARDKPAEALALLALLGYGVGPVSDELSSFCGLPQCLAAAAATEVDCVKEVVRKAFSLLNKKARVSEDVGISPADCAKAFLNTVILAPSPRFRIDAVFQLKTLRINALNTIKDFQCPFEGVWSTSSLLTSSLLCERLLDALNTDNASWTTALLRETCDEVLSVCVYWLHCTRGQADLPSEAVERPGFLDRLSSRLAARFCCPDSCGFSPHELAVDNCGTIRCRMLPLSAFLWRKYGLKFTLKEVSMELYSRDSFSLSLRNIFNWFMHCIDFFCGNPDAVENTTLLLAHCMQVLIPAPLQSDWRALIFHKLESLTITNESAAVIFLEAMKASFPTLLDDAAFSEEPHYFSAPGGLALRHLHELGMYRRYIFLGYLQRTGYIASRVDDFIEYYVNRESNLDKGSDALVLLSRGILIPGVDEEVWLTELESENPTKAYHASIAMYGYYVSEAHGKEWVLRHSCNGPRIKAIRDYFPGLFERIVPGLVLTYGKLLQDFIVEHPGTLDTARHELAMSAFLSFRNLCPATDVLGAMQALSLKRDVVHDLHAHHFPEAKSYMEFDHSLRCSWILELTRMSHEASKKVKKRPRTSEL